MDHADAWKPGVKPILQYYNERIEGSKIDERHCSLIFDYSKAEDPKGAFKQAGECANHINDASYNLNVHAVPVEGALIVSPADVNKSSATALIGQKLEELKHEKGVPLPDLLFVVGDSREDEYVFNWAHKMEKKGIRNVVTVTLGARNTEASATLTQGVTGTCDGIVVKLVFFWKHLPHHCLAQPKIALLNVPLHILSASSHPLQPQWCSS
jgi:trehalose 6-phosphate synthase/phosphatase